MSCDLAGASGSCGVQQKNTVQDWVVGEWTEIGTLSTESRDAEDPNDDVLESWVLVKADEILLA